HDPAVDLPELFERAVRGQELSGMAGRAARAIRVPHLHRMIAAAVGEELAIVRALDPRARHGPVPVTGEALHEAARVDVGDARVVAQPCDLVAEVAADGDASAIR